MKAVPGDRIVLRSRFLVRPIRDGEILETWGYGGDPPYLIRWSDAEWPTLFVPGHNAHLLPRAHPPRPPEIDG